ncbi:MAG: DNA primase [Methanomicrobiales archaeon]|nr:DNA primase [Methanomicrobiales archaeon]
MLPDSTTTKYLIRISIHAEGVVEKSDVVGAIFGQTEGLLGEDLDLRDLQRTGRVGRIDVQIASKKGETRGEIFISSSLDRAETAILAASLESIDRVGPCVAHVTVDGIEDIRVTKRRQIVSRAKELLLDRFDEGSIDSGELLSEVRECIRIEKITELGEVRVPAGPQVLESDAIIIVEGRADVINLLRYGIKNAVAVEGTKVPAVIVDLCRTKTATAFLDGDRGGELILRELLQVADIDYVALCPYGRSVEEMTRKEITKSLRNKVPVEYIKEQVAEREEGGKPKSPEPITVAPLSSEGYREESSNAAPAALQECGVPTLKTHMEQVKGSDHARLLASDLSVLQEPRAGELERALEAGNGEIAGIVMDRALDQKLLDRIAGKGIEFVAAREFKGIIKRPAAIRLLKIG